MSPKKQSTNSRRARAAAREGQKFTAALRGESPGIDSVEFFREVAEWTDRFFPRDGAPALPTPYSPDNDVDPICGHHRRSRCASCGSCATCDGCYCGELADEAALDAEDAAYERIHFYEHDGQARGCTLCDADRERTAGYTRCPKCSLEFRQSPAGQGYVDFVEHGTYCDPLNRYLIGIDWSYLIGQEAEFVGRQYSVHGVVVGHHPNRSDRHPLLLIRRTDPGYEDGPDETSPVDPREWVRVLPEPPAAD